MAAASDRSDGPRLAEMMALVGGPTTILAAFRRMEIAEEEIAEAKRRSPRARKRLHEAFRFLCPPEVLREKSDALYRAHVRELLGRVKRGEPLEPGTDAEVLAVFSETSLRAPLASDFAHAMSVVFFRVFPDADPDMHTGREGWAGRTSEIIADVRRKVSRARAL